MTLTNQCWLLHAVATSNSSGRSPLNIRHVGAEEPGEFGADDTGADGAEAGFRQRAHEAVLLRAVDVTRLVQPPFEEANRPVGHGMGEWIPGACVS